MNLEPHRFRKLSLLIIYSGRTYEAGKEINWRDGMVALWFIVKYRFSSNYADPGKVALHALEEALLFNQWMYDSIKPYLGRRLAELGAGRGNLSRLLRSHGHLPATGPRAADERAFHGRGRTQMRGEAAND